MRRKIKKTPIFVERKQYGNKVVAIEPGGAEIIQTSERHGKPINLFWTWSSPNWEFATMFVGVIPVVVFGGGFLQTAVALVLGGLLGSCSVGLLSTWGPKFGIPQMVHSRGTFGYRWNFIPATINSLTVGIGWVAVNSISGSFALNALTHISFQTSLIIIVLLQAVIAFIGHNFIHKFEKYTFPFLAVIFTITCLIVLSHANFSQGFNSNAPVAFGGSIAAVIIAFSIAFAYAGGWSPYAMDYARYLPEKTKAKNIFWAVTLGIFVPVALLQITGAALATVVGTKWGPLDNPTSQLLNVLPMTIGQVTLLAIIVGGISANALNVYTGSISFIATGIKIGRVKWQRAASVIVFGLISYVVARFGEVDAGRSYENFLLILSYWIAPFLGVIIVDYFLRKGRYNTHLFYDKTYNPLKGIFAWGIGLLASVPFWNQSLWHGFVIDAFPQTGDLSFIVGFLVASIAYYLFKTRLT